MWLRRNVPLFLIFRLNLREINSAELKSSKLTSTTPINVSLQRLYTPILQGAIHTLVCVWIRGFTWLQTSNEEQLAGSRHFHSKSAARGLKTKPNYSPKRISSIIPLTNDGVGGYGHVLVIRTLLVCSWHTGRRQIHPTGRLIVH